MKQSKRLLCVLLAMLMMLSTLTVAASAYKENYLEAAYDDVNEPYFTNAQAASALLDYVDDDILSGMNVQFDISALSVHVHIYSLDSLFDSVKSIFDSSAYSVGSALFSLGDIEKMNWSIPKNSGIRRRSATMSDFEFLSNFLQFLQVNYNYLYKWADNSFKLGLIKNFWDPKTEIPMLNDLHGYINEMVYKALIDKDGVGFDATTAKLDDIVQDFLNNRCVKFICDMLAKGDGSNAVADFLGLPKNEDGTLKNVMGLLQLCPNLKASDISITQTSTYDFITNLLNAAINDVVLPFAGGLILDALKIEKDDTSADTSYIDIAIDLFVKNESVGLPDTAELSEKVAAFLEKKGVENPTAPKPIDKINTTLAYILSDGIKQYIYFQDDGNGGKYLTLSPDLVSELANYIKMLLPILGTLWAAAPTLSTEQSDALAKMNDEQTFAFAIQFLLDALVDGVRFPKNCDTIKELVTYTFVNIAAELIPDVDFEAKIASGEINPNSAQCLDVAAAVGRYYLVGETGIKIENKTPTFEELLNDCFDYYLNKYSKLFNVYPTESDYQTYKNNVWYKIYMSANQWIPFTNIVYGVEDSWSGMQEIVMDKLINGILDFDIQKILSLIGQRPDSDLQKPLSKVIANLLARVINGVFQLPSEKTTGYTDNAKQKDSVIIPYAYTTLDQIITNVNSTPDAINGTGLKNTVNRLLYYITNVTGEGSLCATSLDVVATLMGVLKLKEYDYMKKYYEKNCPAGTTYSISQLKTLYNRLALKGNDNLKYYEDGYEFFRMVDFAPWTYLDFNGSMRSAKSIIEKYDAAKANPDAFTFPTRAEITYAYYSINEYNNLLLGNATTANDYQLNKVFTEATSGSYDNSEVDGHPKYTERSWNAYQHAITFATTVMNEYAQSEEAGTLGDYRQSKINAARKGLIDAIDGLKDYVGLANYSDLDIAINRIPTLSNPSRFSSESVQNVIDAYKNAIKTDRDYDVDDQKIVDAAYEELTKAISKLEPLPSIELYDTESQHIDDEFGFMYGFNENFYSKEDEDSWGDFATYFMVDYGSSSDGDVALTPTANGNGTGSKIQIVTNENDTKKVVKEYTLVIFGDVNGDSKIDAQDAVVMRTYASFMLDSDLSAQYVLYSSDLNFDGVIGTTDAKTVEKAGLNKAEINQRPETYTNKQITFLDIINKQG